MHLGQRAAEAEATEKALRRRILEDPGGGETGPDLSVGETDPGREASPASALLSPQESNSIERHTRMVETRQRVYL